MKTAFVPKYGPAEVIQIVEAPTPTVEPRSLLIRVVSTSVTAADWRMRSGTFPPGFGIPARLALGLLGPRCKVLGGSYSGVVEAIGEALTGFAPGDEVCGIARGTWAEYVVADPAKMVKKPAGISHDHAAAMLFGGLTARYFLKDRVEITAGQRVLINGAAGVVGSNAVGIANALGANVTAVARGEAASLLCALGAAQAIDYHATSLDQLTEQFDIVFDASGALSIPGGRQLLKPDGKLILVAANLYQQLPRKNVLHGLATERATDIEYLLGLMARGAYTPAIDSVYPLDQIVEANRRFELGGKQGVVIVHPGS